VRETKAKGTQGPLKGRAKKGWTTTVKGETSKKGKISGLLPRGEVDEPTNGEKKTSKGGVKEDRGQWEKKKASSTTPAVKKRAGEREGTKWGKNKGT